MQNITEKERKQPRADLLLYDSIVQIIKKSKLISTQFLILKTLNLHYISMQLKVLSPLCTGIASKKLRALHNLHYCFLILQLTSHIY